MFTKKKSSNIEPKIVIAAVCITFIFVAVVLSFLRSGKKNDATQKQLSQIKSKIKSTKKTLRDRKSLLNEIKTVLENDSKEAEQLEKELTSELKAATKEFEEKK